MTILNAPAFDRLAYLSAYNLSVGYRVVLLLALTVLGRTIYQRWVSPLRKVPGPFLASFTDLWWLCIVLNKQQHLESIRLHERYGPFVRIGPSNM